MTGIINWIKSKFADGKKWMLGTALKKVGKRLLPIITTAVAGFVVAHDMGFVEVIGNDVIIHLEGGMEYLIAALSAALVGGGVAANKIKHKLKEK